MDQEDENADNILSILSKGPWCIEVLEAAAQQGSCSTPDLMRLLKQTNPKGVLNPSQETPLTDDVLDRCLNLLRAAKLVNQSGERITITRLGSASAARLDPIKKRLPSAQRAPVAATSTPKPNFSVSGTHRHENDSISAQAGLTPETSSASQMIGRKYISLLVPVVAIFIAVFYWSVSANNPADGMHYRFAEIRQGDFKISTIATGRIEAVDSVEVSSQLSGQVIKLYADFNDKVAAGVPLAQLDDKTFKAAVAEAQARLAHAKASHNAAVAKIVGTEARFKEAQADYRRKNILKKHGGVSTQQLDKAQANMATAQSEFNAARADETVQAAAIDEAKAALDKAQINLDRTIIRSPIAGTVIKRSVELGQTVAVSMKAPTLFTIARNLNHMRVHARVDEADIGRIRVGQRVDFSVDAYPNRTFTGRVIGIHHAPKIVQNVVTYTVVISAENHDLALLPGMTAIVHIVTTDLPHAVLVPTAALRFNPVTVESSRQATGGADRARNGAAQVWIRTKYGNLQRTKIGIGKSNGVVTEVLSGPLSAGEIVAVGKRVVHDPKTLFGIRLGFR